MKKRLPDDTLADLVYVAPPLSGVATGGSDTTIVDSSLHVTVDLFKDKLVKVGPISGVTYWRKIASNTANTLTIPALVAGVQATGTLTLDGVVKDGETVTIGSQVYEFAADAAQSVTAGRTAVDIQSQTTKAQGTLTVDTQPTAGDTMTLGSTVYTFVANDKATPVAGDIKVGTDLATAQAAIVAAINGTDDWNDAHPSVSAGNFAANACVLTALVGGTVGNAIASTETYTAETNVFDAATLGTTTAGADCTAANAVTRLVAEINAHDTQGVGAADGAGDTVVLTADAEGTAANAYATTETMAHGSFGATTLEGGVDQVDCVAGTPYEVVL